MSVFDGYTKRQEFLICVDSDGCAMDTMARKHFHCFGPYLVMEWELEQWRTPVLERWNDLNLFRMTRGIGRFQALATVLSEVDREFRPVPGLQTLERWVRSSGSLTNADLAQAILAEPEGDGRRCLEKALMWSDAVDAGIAQLPEALRVPFSGVAECLEQARSFADVAVVTGANRDAVEAEWTEHGLIGSADILLAKDIGDKTYCIGKLLDHGYEPEKVLMVGDAPRDMEAAKANGVWFYPVLVNEEVQSWEELRQTGFQKLRSGDFAGYQKEKERQFLEHLGG